MVNLALIGYGRWGEHYGEALARVAQARLYAVVDANPERLAAARARLPDTHVFDAEVDALWADPKVEAVIVNAPSPEHYALALQALQAGKHVLVEKPVSLRLAEAQTLARAAEGRVFMPAHILRFWPLMQMARALVAGGAIGAPLHFIERRVGVNPGFPPAPPWWQTLEGFLLYHFGSHTLDAALWVLEARPVRVFARGQARHIAPEQGAVDDFALILETDGGPTISLQHCLVGPQRTHDWLMHGERGKLEIEGFTRLLVNGEEHFREHEDLNQLGLGAEVREFVDAIAAGRPPQVSGRDVLPAMAVIEAALTSLRSGRAESVPAWEV